MLIRSFNYSAIILVCLISSSHVSEGANIMFYFGMSSYSHRIGVWPLVEALADRGHNVSFVSPFPAKKPNPKVHDYVPKALAKAIEEWDEPTQFYEQRVRGNQEEEWFKLEEYGLGICEVVLGDQDFIGWLNSSQFDLVVIDALINECAYGISYKMGAKVIVYNVANPMPWIYSPFGIPDESSWLPDMIYHPPTDMNLYERFTTMAVPLYYDYLRETSYFPMLRETIKEKLAVPDIPNLADYERNNVSLVFINHHYSEDYARPLPPNVIPVAGLQCSDKNEKLPKDLEDFINKGDGFVYVSFGSYAEISNLPEEKRNVFVNVFKNLKGLQVVWKINIERPKDLPDSVYTAKWIPQQTVLAHPKAKAFVTHSGLFGIQEAIFNAVPLICFPIFAEQDSNAEKVHSREIGLRLDVVTVTEKALETTIHQIVSEPKFAKNMKKRQAAFRDRPMSAVDTAVYWTEYVLRTEDTSFLRPGSVNQSWWKRRLLDIYALIFLTSLIILQITWTVLKFAFSLANANSNNDSDRKIKQN